MFLRVAMLLFLAFVVELMVAISIAGQIGVLITLLVGLVLSVGGVVFLRSRGSGFVASTLAEFGASRRVDPAQVADKFLTMVAGFLLVLPGFVTAAFGLLLFLPPVRASLRPVVLARVSTWTGLNLRFAREVVDVDGFSVDTDQSPAESPTSARRQAGLTRGDTHDR